MGIGSFILSLFGIRTITQDFITVPDQPYLELDPAFFTVTSDPPNERNVVSLTSASPTFTGITASSYLITGQSLPLIGPRYTLRTVDNAAHTIATIAIPAASTVNAEVRVIANLGETGSPNKNGWPTVYRTAAIGVRTGSGGPTSAVATIANNVSAPFRAVQNTGSPGPGSFNAIVSGNNLLLQVVGFVVKEAWTTGHTYVAGDGGSGGNVPGDFVTNAGNVYLCVIGGVAGASAPTGTGIAISDGTDTWAYIGPAIGNEVPVDWTMIVGFPLVQG